MRLDHDEHLYQLCAMGLLFKVTADGRRLQIFNVIEDDISLCRAIRLGPLCKAKDVVVVTKEVSDL